MEFWRSLDEATKALGGKGYTEKEPLVGNGQKRWPSVVQLAVVRDTPDGDVTLRRVECYGWQVSEESSQ
jgi:hypothetical protein